MAVASAAAAEAPKPKEKAGFGKRNFQPAPAVMGKAEGVGDRDQSESPMPEGDQPATGIRSTAVIPKSNYEIRLEAKRTDGNDFFCGLTFPVQEGFATLIVGGWGGGVTGISNIDGFATEQAYIGTPDLGSAKTSQVPGEETFTDSSLKFYLDSVSNPLRATLDPGTQGFIVFADFKPSGSIVATDLVDVYPIEVGSTPKERDMGATAAQWTANMAITDDPREDVAVAA